MDPDSWCFPGLGMLPGHADCQSLMGLGMHRQRPCSTPSPLQCLGHPGEPLLTRRFNTITLVCTSA